MKRPENAADVLQAMKHPLCSNWSWMRREGNHGASASVYVDDIPNDIRTVIEIQERPGTVPHIRVCKLHKFDPAKNRWNAYKEERIGHDATDRKGWKSIVQYVQEHALKTTGVPNPKHVHFFAQ